MKSNLEKLKETNIREKVYRYDLIVDILEDFDKRLTELEKIKKSFEDARRDE